MNNCIIVFLKYPEPGKVKTKLAKTLGDKPAAEFYKCCTEYTLMQLKNIHNSKSEILIFYSNDSPKAKINNWLGNELKTFEQHGNDLGEKMYNAFQRVFNLNYKKAIIVGTDLPDISNQLIQKTIYELEINDYVIGPAEDGGYYLLGMNSLQKSLFENINWSTKTVFEDTLNKLYILSGKVKVLEKLNDIDTEEELINWMEKNKAIDHSFKNYLKKCGLNLIGIK